MQAPFEQRRNVAYVFPGQGSQFVGMGKSLVEHSPAARAVFAEADETLHFPLTQLCIEGPADELRDTVNAQPAILTMSIACLAALREQLGEAAQRVQPRLVAGHSLGEYSALVAAGVLDFATAVQLVRERGRLMKETGDRTPGGMAAVIGLDANILEDLCRRVTGQGVVCPANYNSPSQTVISGELAALSAAIELAVASGAQRVIRLAVSIASHSPVMQLASEQFTDVMNRFRLQDAVIPIVSDISARVLVSAEEIRAELSRQLYSSVRWTDTVREMLAADITTYVEIGPGDVLSSLIKRIDRRVQTFSINDTASAQNAAQRLIS
ncbi:MAG TPA: ACP S-malonyltransferase [Chloroflexota bacterium]|nr:ACP S-malonyltransferase [Chloroflexota bacterium]